MSEARVGLIKLSAQQLQHPALLSGLDEWLQLGLLSPAQVTEFCHQYLVCELVDELEPTPQPTPQSTHQPPNIATESAPPERRGVGSSAIPDLPVPVFADDFADALAPAPVAPSASDRSPDPRSSWPNRTLQAFMAEIGVIWLLGLGVFMVVVSSGLLAASRWQTVSPLGQYGILFTYTLAFWGASLWTQRRPTLRLTAQMLQLATLLLVPVNFWMMDGLNLWRQPLGLGLNLLAAVMLALISRTLLRQLLSLDSAQLPWLNLLGLSGLHWGWNWAIPSLPLLATYFGTVGTAFLTLRQWQAQRRRPASGLGSSPTSPATLTPTDPATNPTTDPATNPTTNPATSRPTLTLTTGVVVLAVLLLLGRAVLTAGVPLAQLGLAIGICGGLFCWLGGRIAIWVQLGWAGLLLGWAVTIADNPLQAVGVSGLGLWLLGKQFENDRRQGAQAPNWQPEAHSAPKPTLTWVLLLLLGLQTYLLLWRLWPLNLRQSLVAALVEAWGSTGMPLALVALAGFPYLWLLLGLARWQRRSRELARLTKAIVLGFGGLLLLLGWLNPTVRAIVLSLAALTLALSLRRNRLAQRWPYLCHLLILAALFAWIEARLPGLGNLTWAKILLIAMALEWGLSLGLGRWRSWQQTCWHFGLGLAGLSYVLLFQVRVEAAANAEPVGWLTNPGLLWLLTPILLTGLAWLKSEPSAQPIRGQTAAWLSSGSLVAQLFLLASSREALVACGIATGLMLINVVQLQSSRTPAGVGLAAWLTVGFGLGAKLAAIVTFSQLSFSNALLWLAATLWLLWLLQEVLTHRPPVGFWGPLYATATRRWFLGLALGTLGVLTAHFGLAASLNRPVATPTLLSSLLIGAVLALQLWRSSVRQQASELMFYQLAWAALLAIVAWVGWRFDASLASRWQPELLAALTLGLGLATQLGGDLARAGQPQQGAIQTWRPSWQIIPLGYAVLGLLSAHLGLLGLSDDRSTAGWAGLEAYTGLYTLAAALISLGVGRRAPQLKPITLAGLLLATGAAYELLIYRLLQASGGSWGDGVALLAGLAALLAGLLRLGRPWLLPYLRLAVGELEPVAHLHWALGSGLALLALAHLSDRGFWIWFAVAVGLSAYALLNGRLRASLPEQSAVLVGQQDQRATDLWTYAGIAQALGLVSYSLIHWLPDSVWLAAGAAALAAVGALGLYFLPWPTWGWSARPWQNMALFWPGAVVLLTFSSVALQSLLLVAAFYAWIAKTEARPRLSYLGLVLLDWAVLRYLTTQGWLNFTWLSALLAASLLYLAQVDPALQTLAAKQQRHALRSFAVGLLSLTLLYQAEVETGQTALVISGLTLLGGLALVFLGLALRTRAFLYVGTVTFMLKVLRLFWQFVNQDSLLLWASGILVGLSLIWVAATFEARRSQVSGLMQYWLTEFERWE